MAENPKCSEQDCVNDAEFLCPCKDPSALLCTAHLHKDQSQTPIPIYKSLSELERNLITQLCLKCKEECKALNSKIFEQGQYYISFITNATNELLNNIRKTEMLYDNILNFVNDLNLAYKVKYLGELTLSEKIIASQAGKLNVRSSNWELPDVNLDIKVNIGNIPDLLEYLDEQSSTSHIVFFKKGTKTLVRINPNKLKVSTFGVKVDENMSYSAGFCQMNDGNIFYCCGDNGAVNNSAYLVNPSQRTVQKLANAIVAKSYIGTCTQYKDNIYVFGGTIATGAATNICERYEISSYK